MYIQFGNSNRQQRPNLVLNRSLTCVKSAAISLYVAKLSAAAHFDLADCMCYVCALLFRCYHLCDSLAIQDVKIFNNKVKLDHS